MKNVGVAGRNARATNIAESENIQEFDGSNSSAGNDTSRMIHASEIAIIKAMQSNSLYTHASAQDPSLSRRPLDRDPLDPTNCRLVRTSPRRHSFLSRQQAVPILFLLILLVVRFPWLSPALQVLILLMMTLRIHSR